MNWQKLNDLVLPLAIIGCLVVFIVPLPAAMLDILLVGNIAIALIVLLTSIQIHRPLDFSVFPTLLLATTLCRLVCNVASTRLILLDADRIGIGAAGGVIQQFGEFVAGNRLEVGVVMFAIVFVIQLVVITQGSTRISEVAARFTLDGIPGRQMAIDADLNAGVIDRVVAQQRREELSRQADFHGAMDGASKFVRGDAIAGVVITFINLFGGLYLGVIQGGMSLGEATSLYTKLTIGDGLVTQIPALLISLAAGLMVTRGSESSRLSSDLVRQLFSSPTVLGVAGVFLLLLTFTQLPTLPLLVMGVCALGFGYYLHRRNDLKTDVSAVEPSSATTKPQKDTTPRAKANVSEKDARLEDLLHVDTIEVELGVALIRHAHVSRGGDLLSRISTVRQQVALDLGLILPSVRVRDNMKLPESEYTIKVMGNVVARGELPKSSLIVIPPANSPTRMPFPALAFTHPAAPTDAKLIPVERAVDAQDIGCKVVAPAALIADHLKQTVQQLAHELLTRDATQHLIDEVKKSSPMVVQELIPNILKLSEVQQVLQSLLQEGIPIRQLSLILETLGDHAAGNRDIYPLVDLVRRRLARTISSRYQDADGRLHVVTLDPHLEQEIARGITQGVRRDEPEQSNNSWSESSRFRQTLQHAFARLHSENHPPVLLTNCQIRRAVLQLTRSIMPNIVVLGQEELAPDARVRSVSIVGIT